MKTDSRVIQALRATKHVPRQMQVTEDSPHGTQNLEKRCP